MSSAHDSSSYDSSSRDPSVCWKASSCSCGAAASNWSPKSAWIEIRDVLVSAACPCGVGGGSPCDHGARTGRSVTKESAPRSWRIDCVSASRSTVVEACGFTSTVATSLISDAC